MKPPPETNDEKGGAGAPEPAAEWVPLEALMPWAKNPRQNDAAVEKVAASIKRFGFGAPILARRADGEIIAGHTRLKAARKLGLEKVPVRYLDLDPADAHLLALADNRLSEIAEWDDEGLGAILRELQAEDQDLAVAGFDEDEFAALLRDPDATPEGEDPGPGPLMPDAVSKRGEVYELGPHRLLCGDSTSLEDVRRLADGEKAALCSTDPPYLVDYTGERPNDSGKDWTAVYHEVDIEDATGFFRAVFTNVLDILAPHAAIYCWHAHKRYAEIVAVWRELGILDHQQIIWVKPTAVFGRVFWHFRHEPCLMGWRKGSIPAHDGDQTIDSVWEVDWEGKARIVGNEHPTQKPLELFARPIRKHTRPGDLCFEPFGGSGSQVIAAAKEGRRCYAIEIEPTFCDVIRRRWTGYARSAGLGPGPGALD